MRKIACLSLFLPVLAAASPAAAWGDLGHEVVAKIAYRHLTPAVKSKVDALLASDTDPLTAPDIASRATWADKYRTSHRETAAWHFVDIEIDSPNLSTACFGFPALSSGQAASQGQSQDCIVDKINEFATELRNPSTTPSERLLALKFVLHFVGDAHQPLHASDHHDEGGNCIGLMPPEGSAKNLHAFWDTPAVQALGPSADAIASQLDRQITASQVKTWSRGAPKDWAMEAFQVSQKVAYALPVRPTCDARGSIQLTPAYKATVEKDAAMQLQRAGIRLAFVLNQALR
jgi:S1/P1 Nuclease